MDRSKLENLGQTLAVEKGEVRQLKRQRKLESIFDAMENQFVKILTLFSVVWGAIMPTIYGGLDAQSYPMSYNPPGGYKAPILVFGGGTGIAGFIKAGHIHITNPPDKKHQLFMVRAIVSLVFIYFCVGYAFGLFAVGMNSWSLYNVYSRDEDQIARA